ncbi:MAG TPA: phosphoenolpyruvate carboxylase [Pseudomonadales bacterium]|nr:phosphoenolpyruvate carboxylase [Gammaproteobacteria bacterium]MDP6025263.1 phosphoenolpyruvate carboxylase [Pseudomonadales bacterium]MDP6315294.1 phosphoenolpyruvate carboxylase [Pseudomonadales bacterium]MDP7314742.1 phosphoenolpyruvate carboxylase [Pseudomonadales bacterium]HJL60368.1 phosphoenolpyruvate carboxylase [Pseudomonadales bacterium]
MYPTDEEVSLQVDELISARSRHRVRILSTLLGDTMSAQLGQDFLDKIEEIRTLAKVRRQGESSLNSQLQDVLKSLEDDYLISVARAFNQYLNLANIAEQAETTIARTVPYPDDSYLQKVFEKLQQEGIESETIFNTASEIRCELVLTAHPTEITRRTLIQKYNRIAESLESITEKDSMNPGDRIELERLIAEVWHTDEIRTDRPTPQDEAIWGYAVMEHSFWDAVPVIWKGLDRLLVETTGKQLPLSSTPIRVSSWMGGDRDGNPAVTAEVTEEVINLARWMAADLYLRDIDELLSHLSMTQCNDEVRALCNVETHEPYRVVLRYLRDCLTATRNWSITDELPGDDIIQSHDQLFDPLYACYKSLHECGMEIIAEGLLKETLIRISTFGVTLVNLDIRENAQKHTDLLNALTEFIDLGSYTSWPERARQDFLLEELQSRRPLVPENWQPTPEIQETLKTFRLIASCHSEGVSSYIISMAKNPSDVLAVILLLRKCGVDWDIPIVPLFETLDDLENSAWTLERLLRIPWYTKYIKGHQQIMIGYSDSAKDAGQMAAAWAQYRAQEDLVTVGEKYDVDLTLFHGRGGTVGRGGAPAREAILSQPPGSVKKCMRVTEQGEVIRFKYGSPALALNSLDLVLSATIEASLLSPPKPRENWRHLMDKLAETAKNCYRQFVQQDALFLEYYYQGTPEKELSILAMGSRPGRRPEEDDASRSIDNLRAIPWVFAWTQKRLMLPAWLGTDEAFNRGLDGKNAHVLKEMIEEWPFFQTQLDMLEMVLSKADADIARHYDDELIDDHLKPMGNDLRERMLGLISNVNKMKRQSALLEKSPAIKQTLDLRNPYTDPLHFLQIELMSRCRADAEESKEEINKALLVTIAGIAASMRNTG